VEGVVGVIDARAKPRIVCLGYIAFAPILNASRLVYATFTSIHGLRILAEIM
jgi:hypothetical protein